MKTHYSNSIILLIISTLLLCSTSCIIPFLIINSYKPHSESIKIEILKPASSDISKEIKKLVFINRSFIDNTKRVSNTHDKQIARSRYLQDSIFSKFCVDTISGILNAAGRFSVIKVDENKWKEADSLTWETISEICETEGSQALISLRKFTTFYSKPFFTNKSLYNSVFIKRISIICEFILYFPKNKEILDTVKLDKHFIINSTAYNVLENSTDNENIENMVIWLSKVCAARISPAWATVNRYLYSDGSPEMELALTLAKESKWNEAYAIWEKNARENNNSNTKYCFYNMAVRAEVDDNMKDAIEYASKSSSVYKFNEAEIYLNVLEKRVKDNEKLDKQLSE